MTKYDVMYTSIGHKNSSFIYGSAINYERITKVENTCWHINMTQNILALVQNINNSRQTSFPYPIRIKENKLRVRQQIV